jgi:hypothetical protein
MSFENTTTFPYMEGVSQPQHNVAVAADWLVLSVLRQMLLAAAEQQRYAFAVLVR